MKNQKVRKAIIPAAGLGTRFLPATKALAKEMIPIVDKQATGPTHTRACGISSSYFCFSIGQVLIPNGL